MTLLVLVEQHPAAACHQRPSGQTLSPHRLLWELSLYPGRMDHLHPVGPCQLPLVASLFSLVQPLRASLGRILGSPLLTQGPQHICQVCLSSSFLVYLVKTRILYVLWDLGQESPSRSSWLLLASQKVSQLVIGMADMQCSLLMSVERNGSSGA